MAAHVPVWLIRVQDRWSALLGCTPDARPGVVSEMMSSGPSESTGYWLQLVLSVGIGTMGLVLDSGAVVIAAMLVAPLMIPIVSLGMGLAIGSPYLVLRSGARILASVLLAAGGAAVLVAALPFQTVTSEIAARTVPTALDLVTAAFCALAGVYAAMRPSSDVASTAAGTSIGIALVPPLCACGYGLGTMDLDAAGGAALLFLTNVVAIVVVGTLSFAAMGFTRVDVHALEREVLEREGATAFIPRLARRFARLFVSRRATALRIAMPLVLMGAVYVPLRAALDEVTWQIRVRQGVDALIEELGHEVLETNVQLDRHVVELAVVLIGTMAEAEEVRARLDRGVREIAGAAPRLAVYAVPDASDFAGLQDSLRNRPLPPVPVPVPAPVPQPDERIDDALSLVETSLLSHWPADVLGEVLVSRLEEVDDAYRVTVVHHGPPLDAAARELLGSVLAEELGHSIGIEDAAVPRLVMAPREGLTKFLPELSVWAERARSIESLWLCVEAPPVEPPRRRRPPPEEPGRSELLDLVRGFPRSRVLEGPAWKLHFSSGGCDDVAPG